MNVKKYDLALEDFNKVINLNSNSYEAFLNRGNIYIKEKKYDEAINNYKQALVLKPDYALAYYNKGLAEYDLGNKDAACTDLKQAASLGFKPASDILPKICN
jgi:tetratricopeptide (TPR) repeat protein